LTTLLDTNVLSELLRPRPDQGVLAWFAAQPADSMFVSAITEAEMRLGVRLLPAGKRRDILQNALDTIFGEDFAGRVLPFDSAAASAYASIVSARRGSGRPISQFDAQIASIALCRGASLATRNLTDFEGCGLVLTDPWVAA